MADPRQLAQLHRIAQIRRDRGAVALADAGQARAAEDAALARVAAAEQAALAAADAAIRAFADDPACAQAQLWRRIARDRAGTAAQLTREQGRRRDGAVAAQDHARAALLQAEVRVDQAAVRATAARRAASTRLEERAAEDLFVPGRKP
ncbi:hypothetical protein SAMN06297144_1542 [Sphingomonas guangdongensis]|uniref:Flagellar FliJ protein n=1 Tax=Sphingomonas guangdongensis TaxID=1141890 RepID=A0A285R242_9SPHN|nr:hypothetical protein [Sphingomonas guangdongensis]SOB86437.1 hypothetical protein SAMN06297144_1542 [Sphingomonas guangdongensis]